MDKKKTISFINKYIENTMIDYLDIVFTNVGDNFIEAEMPVEQKTYNPARILHGGAMMALAETVGSALSYLLIDMEMRILEELKLTETM